MRNLTIGAAVGGVMAGALSGCVAHDPQSFAMAGAWRIDRRIDRVTAAPVAGAAVITANSSHSDHIGTRPASIQLTCFERQPIVRLAFAFKIGSDTNTLLGYRFDDKPGRDNVDSRVLFGQQVVVIESRAAVAQFIADLAGSKLLFVRLRSLHGGRTAAEFRVDGHEVALPAAYADCPLSPDPPPRRTS